MPVDHPSCDVETALGAAIDGRRLISFVLEGHPRVAEPHDYGVIKGERKLFFFQVGGGSRSAPAVGWRWAALARITDLRVLDGRFAGPRPAPSGRHQRWDRIIASVSRPPTGDAPR
jgi:hypothetical protein